LKQILKIITNSSVQQKFNTYPPDIKKRLLFLRNLIIETATEIGASEIEETLKWGEPSYLTKKGSTIRIDWKEKSPLEYAIYFKCTSKLVPTFKLLYGDTFQYENNRAILFNLDEVVPIKKLKICIGLALNYHNVKHLPNLGAELS
jgi:hypothetical protein